MISVVEALAIILAVGGLALLAMGAVTFDQAMALIGVGIGLISGKYIARIIKKSREARRS
ncbi:MAG: hypothetical protein QW689_06160 [Nitrososphaerota archaeon]